MTDDSAAAPGGVQARALAVAMAEFAATGYDLTRFDVIVRIEGDQVEVVFVPEQEPGHSVRGGGTVHGRELHYWVSAADATLLRTHFAR
jgi:hypothetical protein